MHTTSFIYKTKYVVLVIFLLLTTMSTHIWAQISYPIIAHSHNDYAQKTPIHTALSHGFRSLEVDILLDGEQIKVSHDLDHLDAKPEFISSYLNPLIASLNEQSQTLLIIDIKEYTPDLIDMLNQYLENYEDYLVKRNDSLSYTHPLQIILSGDIPSLDIINDPHNEYLFIDGRIHEMRKENYALYTPLISMDFSELTKWKGRRRPDPTTLKKIHELIDAVHAQGKKIRFWNTEENTLLWSTLIGLGVDIIGVDDIENFYQQMKELNLTQ